MEYAREGKGREWRMREREEGAGIMEDAREGRGRESVRPERTDSSREEEEKDHPGLARRGAGLGAALCDAHTTTCRPAARRPLARRPAAVGAVDVE